MTFPLRLLILRRWHFVVAVMGMIAAVVPADATAMRCSGRILEKGDPMYQVRDRCGPPDYVVPLETLYNRQFATSGSQRWYYNRGSNQLLRELHFRDGELRRIKTAGRGFNSSAATGACNPRDISTRMTGYELLSRCGKPAQIQQKHVLRTVRRNGVRVGHQPVWVEDWFYPFDDNHFDRRVRLVNGRVEEVDTAD